ncbi:MAG: glycoside hydrolase family 3 C-terminal domain-containing protein, partial [Clostridia bacterium]|nr:glycoside hydrolase family 3 C-terminal domain-containing protein [Clostridia bacterium]
TIAEKLTEEGAVLLKNENAALPIALNAKISLFGHSSANMIVCGTGSADIDASEAPNFKQALESRGVAVNPTLWKFYVDNIDTYATNPEKGDNSIRNGADGVTKGEYTVNEIPWNVYTTAAKSEFNDYKDAAIVVFSRLGGEMYDLPATTAQQGNSTETVGGSGNALELTIQERDLLKQIKAAGFEKTIVLLNSTNAMECDFVDDPELGVDACMWIGYTGVVGLYGVSDLLVGNDNPSGRLVDTYCMDNTTSPAHVNIYGATWSNAKELGSKMFNLGLDGNTYFNVYQEGIYVGYRYYETRYEDYVLNQGNHGDYNYANDVKYAFGYGKSYTEFQYSNFSVTENTDSFDVKVTVTNIGSTAGKEVVEVYFQSPYTDYDKQNGIEKAAIELCGFAKTEKLAVGASETVTVNVPKQEFRTYDAYGEKTYILDKGDYYLSVGKDAHDALNNVLAKKGADVSRMTAAGDASFVHIWNNPAMDTETYSVSKENGEEYKITNQLSEGDLNLVDNGAQSITYLSRSNWVGTFPTVVSLRLT